MVHDKFVLQIKFMSGEQSISGNVETAKAGTVISRNRSKTSGRVDINKLMSRVRDEEKKQKKENLVFFGLISSVIIISGIIASL